jgi:hypothetical protein
MMQNIRAPHPIKRLVRRGESRAIAMLEDQSICPQYPTNEVLRRLDAFRNTVNAGDMPSRPNGFCQPQGVEPNPAADV